MTLSPVLWIVIGLMLGIVIGVVLLAAFFKMKGALLQRFAGEYIGIVYNIDTDKWEIVGLLPMGQETFYSNDPERPLFVIKPPDVQIQYIEPLKKPAMFVIAKRLHGFAVNPENLIKIGVGSLTINDITWSQKEPVIDRSAEIIENLMKYQGKEYGEINVNPDIKIGFGIRIPDIAKSIMNFLASISLASITAQRDNILTYKKFTEIWQKMQQGVGIGGKTWQYIGWLLIIGGSFFIVWQVIGHIFH